MEVSALRIIRVVLLPCAAASFISWWLVGDLSERGGYDRIVDLALLRRHAGLLGLVGLLLLGVVAVDVAAQRVRHRIATIATIATIAALAAVAGGAVGFAGRVITAEAVGANIGGSFLLFVAPPAVAATLALLAVRAHALGRR